MTPDTIADFSGVRIDDAGRDRVRVDGASGRPRPDTLKVSVGQYDGWIGEGQISYAGPGAEGRARLAADIVQQRLTLTSVHPCEVRYDLIGIDALHGPMLSSGQSGPYEVRLRVAARTETAGEADRIAREVETLYTNGPAGGGGVSMSVRRVLAMRSTLVPRQHVPWRVDYETLT